MNSYNSIGIMSGTSLDGIDIVEVLFEEINGQWKYTIGASEFIPYTKEWQGRLSSLMKATALEYVQTHNDYGSYTAEVLNRFIHQFKIKTDIIGVHGHTVFHQPDKGYTTQIGNAAIIAAETKCLVAADFRSMDVARGGQGAPLVPIGDKLLFGAYSACMNIGGFANISILNGDTQKAFDICPVNIVMNPIAESLGFPYDDKGLLAKSGVVDNGLLAKLNALPYYSAQLPKSLGKEWVASNFLPLFPQEISKIDLLRTLIEHISTQIATVLTSANISSVLLTGGGTYNDFLIQRIKEKTKVEIVIPSSEIIDMKEALIFAFLGVLRVRNQQNILSGITGANNHSISGALYNGAI